MRKRSNKFPGGKPYSLLLLNDVKLLKSLQKSTYDSFNNLV